MQALERTVLDSNWITILMVFLLICISLLKGISVVRLKGVLFSIVNTSYIEEEIEENTSFFNLFKSIVFLFSMLVFSLAGYKIIVFYKIVSNVDFYTFLNVLGAISAFFTVKWLLEIVFSYVFLINKQIKFFLFSKLSYLYSLSFYLLIALVLVEYSQLNTVFLIYFSVFLFAIRFLLHVANNKKLIFSELFYFILYLCAFEIAPLFILFKLIF